jgi:hypothetical protein
MKLFLKKKIKRFTYDYCSSKIATQNTHVLHKNNFCMKEYRDVLSALIKTYISLQIVRK